MRIKVQHIDKKKNVENNTDNPLGVQPVNNLLIKFAVPSIIAMLVSALYNIVEIGRASCRERV